MPNFTREQMEQAFKNVQNPKGWKYPINKVIQDPGPENQACLNEAIVYFTGSIPEITTLKGGKIRVKADGYYACIGT